MIALLQKKKRSRQRGCLGPNMKNRLLSLVAVIAVVSIPLIASGEDLEMVNRPVNTSGLTGLLITTGPYTAASGTIEVAASILYENSVTPEFALTEYPLSVTVGLPHNSELSLRGSYFELKEGPTATAVIDRKSGDLQLSYKWNFLPQAESSLMPAVALIVAGMVPMEKNIDPKINIVERWGFAVGLSAGTEITWSDHVLGIYADAQLRGRDPDDKSLRDLWTVVNAGLLFPISKFRNLQILFEYTIVNKKDKITADGGDYSAATYGLRLLSEQFNLTIGTQVLRKQTEGFENSGRIIGLMSVKF
jgi:hypothetical protein